LKKREAAGPSQRQLRVAEEIRHVLAGLFERRDFRDPDLAEAEITVAEVRVSPDLKHATAFVMPLAGAKLADVLAGLGRSAGYLRRELAKEVQLRHAPELHFSADTSFEHASRINELLHRPEVERDLRPDEGPKHDGA